MWKSTIWNTILPLCECHIYLIRSHFLVYQTLSHDMSMLTVSFLRTGQFISVQSLSCVRLFVTTGTAACQASLSFTNSWSLLKLMSIEAAMPSNHLILCRSLLLLPSVFPRIRVFSNESVLWIRWPKYWSCSFSISPSNEYSGLISFRIDWLDLLAVQSLVLVRCKYWWIESFLQCGDISYLHIHFNYLESVFPLTYFS